MIELHSAAEGQIAHDPFTRPLDVQLGNFGNPYGEMITLLERIANFSERQREKVAPDIIDLSPGSGSQIPNSYTVKNNLRIMGLLISGAAGDRLKFACGGRNWSIFSSGVPVFVPFPYTAMMGNDLSVADITNPAATAWSFLVFGYPEG